MINCFFANSGVFSFVCLNSFTIFLGHIAYFTLHIDLFFIFYILISDETAFKNKKIHSIKPLKGYIMLPQLAGHGTSAVQSIWAEKFV